MNTLNATDVWIAYKKEIKRLKWLSLYKNLIKEVIQGSHFNVYASMKQDDYICRRNVNTIKEKIIVYALSSVWGIHCLMLIETVL